MFTRVVIHGDAVIAATDIGPGETAADDIAIYNAFGFFLSCLRSGVVEQIVDQRKIGHTPGKSVTCRQPDIAAGFAISEIDGIGHLIGAGDTGPGECKGSTGKIEYTRVERA